MAREEALFEEIGARLERTEHGQMFGKPCFKINGKAFACFYQTEMVFKLTGDDHGNALSLDGTRLFDPSGKGRAMKEWVQVPYAYKDKWAAFAKAAHAYVGG